MFYRFQRIQDFFFLKEVRNFQILQIQDFKLTFPSGSIKTEAAADSTAQDVFDYCDTYSSYCLLIIGSPLVASKSI